MVERESNEQLSDLIKGVADPTRREILTLLAQQGPMRVTDISRQFPLSLNAISKHIKVLEAAGLVKRRTEWREHLIEFDHSRLGLVSDWLAQLTSIWELRLAALVQTLDENSMEKEDDDE